MKHLTQDHKWKISFANAGRGIGRRHSEQTRQKMSRAHIGKHWTVSEEGRRNISNGKKGRPSPKRGIPLTQEHRTKLSMAHKGKPSHMKGKHHTPKSIKKISHALKERPAWNKGKSNYWAKGENNINWKGGVTPLHKQIRESIEYKLWRTAVFERDKYTCVWCGDQRGGNLEADHIKPFSLFPELRLSIDNGRTLCKSCHSKIGWNLFKENNPQKGCKRH